MGEFFDLMQDECGGVAELVLNQPSRMNTMTPAFFPAVRDAVRTPGRFGGGSTSRT
jgi:enoyl-CoA hydratase